MDSAPGSYAGAMLAQEHSEGLSQGRMRDLEKRRRQKCVVQALDAVRPPRSCGPPRAEKQEKCC